MEDAMMLFVDVETTGLCRSKKATYRDIHNWPRIVSIAWAVHDTTGAIKESYTSIIKPDGFVIPADSSRIHGITTEKASTEGKRLGSVLKQLVAAVNKHKPSLMVAHNMAFDRPIILAEMLRSKMNSSIPTVEDLPTYCTMLNTISYCAIPTRWGQYKFPTLAELHKKLFNAPFQNEHDATSDVAACARCYFKYRSLKTDSPRNSTDIFNPLPDKQSQTSHSQAKGDGDDIPDMIESILAWADEHSFFDTSFVESLQFQYEERGWLSHSQDRSLRNIIARWDIC